MNKRTFILLFLQFLIISNNLADGNAKINGKPHHKKLSKENENGTRLDRVKKSIDDEEDKPFWANRGKKQSEENRGDYGYYRNVLFKPQELKIREDDNHPFWGNRGRRFDIASSEHSSIGDELESDIPELFNNKKGKICQYSCFSPFNIMKSHHGVNQEHLKERREESSPFWGNRGRRNLQESSENENRESKQQDEIQTFWANRGRREEDSPFWGNRGRRQDDSPFWGARGRREDDLPFWGNRGRRQDLPFWGSRGRRKMENLKESINNAINDVQTDIDTLSRLRRSSIEPYFTLGTKTSFWNNRNRENKLQYLFNNKQRNDYVNYLKNNVKSASTLYDDKMLVEQPHFIVVDRSSRSSASTEDDPYYISRGKKKTKIDGKAARDRRGIIEEIVKSVKNDPYYIARGKKEDNSMNATVDQGKLFKTKELICSSIELMNSKDKVKREVSDNDRDRRTILKKLAAQLQNDPYMVSRGKKSDFTPDIDYEEFIARISEMCY